MNYPQKNFLSVNNSFSQKRLSRYFFNRYNNYNKNLQWQWSQLQKCSQQKFKIKLPKNLYRRLMPIFTRENIMRLVNSHFIIIWRRSNYIIKSTRHDITVAIGFKTWGDALVFLLKDARVI